MTTGGGPDLQQRRAAAERAVDLATEPVGVTWRAVDAGGVRGLWADAAGGRTDRVLQYLHGGGYVSGSSASHRRLGGHLAAVAGCRVLLVDYGRAPEHPHPGPVVDSAAAYRWLLAQGVPPGAIALGGDSSGGGLALATALKLRDEGVPGPAAAVAFSLWADLEVLGESVVPNAATDRVVTPERLRELARTFLGGASPRDPLAAPLHGDYRGICPLYLQVGGAEILLDDTLRVARAARRAGVEVVVDVVPRMQHVFQMRAGHSAEADAALARAGRWLDTRWSGPSRTSRQTTTVLGLPEVPEVEGER